MVQKTANRPRDNNGRLKKMLAMERMIEALREAGGGPSITAELAEIFDMDTRTVRAAYAQAVSKPWETPIKGRKSGGVWVFWLEEEKEDEPEKTEEPEDELEKTEEPEDELEKTEEPEGGFHNDLTVEGTPLICNVCGKEFKKDDICYAVDRLKMVDGEEGKINAILQVCRDCMPAEIKKSSWDLIKN